MREVSLYHDHLLPWLKQRDPWCLVTVVDFSKLPDLIVYSPRCAFNPVSKLSFIEMKIGALQSGDGSGEIDITWRPGQFGWIQSRPQTTGLCVWFEITSGIAECRYYPSAVKVPRIDDPRETFTALA